MKKLSNLLQGALLSLAAFSIWSLSDMFTKLSGTSGLSVPVIVGIASWASAIVFLAAYSSKEQRKKLWPKSWKRHGLLLGIGLVSSQLYVLSFSLLPLTTAYIGLFLSPLVISLGASLFMGEPLKPRQVFFILLGFSGVVIALNPFAAHEGPSVVTKGYGALAGYVLLFSFLMLLCRRFQKLETPESLAFVPIFLRAIVFLPFYFGLLGQVTALQAFYTALSGILSGLGMLLIAKAYQRAPAAIVSPFHYSQIITGGLLGYWFWNDKPSLWLIAGSALIILSGLCVAHEAHRQSSQEKVLATTASLL